MNARRSWANWLISGGLICLVIAVVVAIKHVWWLAALVALIVVAHRVAAGRSMST